MAEEPTGEQFETDPGRFITLGRAMMASGKGDRAIAFVEQVLARHPDDALLRRCADAILTHKVPGFHPNMLSDTRRNRAFRAAIEGADLAGKTVLDLGAGSGLLAMMAARAGARRVYACEANAALAGTARQIVAANGFDERIEILACHSTALDAERDLGGGVDVLVSEIFSHELIGEGASASLADAAARLARPGARIIPARASIRVALAEYRDEEPPVKEVEGFDLALFARHARRTRLVATDSAALALRSPPQDLFGFDFRSGAGPGDRRARLTEVRPDGPANGVVQWIRLELGDGIAYENAPGAGLASHWPAVFHPFDDASAPARDQPLAIHGWHDERRLLVWTEA